MKYKFKICALSLLLLLGACQKDIGFGNIDTTYDPQVFIEGILIPGETAKIFISNSLSFFHEKVSPQEIFARGAIVELVSENISEKLQPDSTFDKFRCRWTPFYKGQEIIEYNKTYSLKIDLAGKSYQASTTIDQPKISIDRVEYVENFYDVYGGHDGVIVYLKDQANLANFYRFQMDRIIDNSRKHAHVLDVVTNDCTQEGEQYLVSDLGRTVFSDGPLDGKELKMFIEVSFEYLEGDTATIYMQSLDAQSAAFFQDLDNQLQSILNPFVEPVFLHSTIENAFGVFGSAVRSEPVLFVYPQDNP
ncbi:MAG: DUF4249 family protein [Saprospiraceae bacterium]|nr:DUF4249 family protein [Saprospiraceae bacterium]